MTTRMQPRNEDIISNPSPHVPQRIQLRYSVAGPDGILRVWRQEELGLRRDAVILPRSADGTAVLASPSGRNFTTDLKISNEASVLSPVSRNYPIHSSSQEASHDADQHHDAIAPTKRTPVFSFRDRERNVYPSTPSGIGSGVRAFSAEVLGLDPNVRFAAPNAGFPVRRPSITETSAPAVFRSSSPSSRGTTSRSRSPAHGESTTIVTPLTSVPRGSSLATTPTREVIAESPIVNPLPPVSSRTREATTPLNITVRSVAASASSLSASRTPQHPTSMGITRTPISPVTTSQLSELQSHQHDNHDADADDEPETAARLPTKRGRKSPQDAKVDEKQSQGQASPTKRVQREVSGGKPVASNATSGEPEPEAEVYVGETYEQILAERAGAGGASNLPSLPLPFPSRSLSGNSTINTGIPGSVRPSFAKPMSTQATPQSILKRPSMPNSSLKAPGSTTKELKWGATLSQVKLIPSSSRSIKRSLPRIRLANEESIDTPIVKRVDFGDSVGSSDESGNETSARVRSRPRTSTPYHALTEAKVTYSHSSQSSQPVSRSKPGQFPEDQYSTEFQFGSIGPDDKNTEPALLPLKTFRPDTPWISLTTASATALGFDVTNGETDIFALKPRTIKRSAKDANSALQSSVMTSEGVVQSGETSGKGLFSKISTSISSMFGWGGPSRSQDEPSSSQSELQPSQPSTPPITPVDAVPPRRASSRSTTASAADLQLTPQDIKEVTRVLAFDDVDEAGDELDLHSDSDEDEDESEDENDRLARQLQVISNVESNEFEKELLRSQGSFFSLNPEVYESQWSSVSESDGEDDADDDDAEGDDDEDDMSGDDANTPSQPNLLGLPIFQIISTTTGKPLPTVKSSRLSNARLILRPCAHRLTMAQVLGIKPKFMTLFRKWPTAIFRQLGALTIGELARWRWFHLAVEICRAAERFGPQALLKHSLPIPLLSEIDESVHDLTLSGVLDEHVTIFTELSGTRARLLEERLNVANVRLMAQFRPVQYALILARQAQDEGVDLARVKAWNFVPSQFRASMQTPSPGIATKFTERMAKEITTSMATIVAKAQESRDTTDESEVSVSEDEVQATKPQARSKAQTTSVLKPQKGVKKGTKSKQDDQDDQSTVKPAASKRGRTTPKTATAEAVVTTDDIEDAPKSRARSKSQPKPPAQSATQSKSKSTKGKGSKAELDKNGSDEEDTASPSTRAVTTASGSRRQSTRRQPK